MNARIFKLAACLLLLAAGDLTRGANVNRQVLRGGPLLEAARLSPIAQLPLSNRLELSIALPLRNRAQLDRLLAQLYDPASQNYRQFLTPAEFANQFGPTEADYRALIDFAKSNGLTVVGTHPNRTLLDVVGPVSAVQNAFHVRLRAYRHPVESRTFFAPDAEPSIDLTVPVLSVSGLDDFVRPRPMGLNSNFFNTPAVVDAIPFATGSGPRSNFIGNDFRAAYAPGVRLDGSGQSVGLFELDNYFPGDITTYEALAGLPNVPLTNVFVNGPEGSPGSGNIEVALDIDMAIAMAPGLSQVIVYEGRTPNSVLNRMATDNLARQLSCSWGFGAEFDVARDQIFQQFALQGQSFFQASGDFGAEQIYPPSDAPYITSVGGTSLTTGSNGNWSAETVWPEGGGGISTNYPLPLWQQGVDMSLNQGSTILRNIPDVACVADSVIWLVANNGEQAPVGGTSAAAPLWAGFAALANQLAAANDSPPIGFLNPLIYEIGRSPEGASAFHDITVGNNTNTSSANRFFATPGYDLCTGWGTPAGSNLLSALAGPPGALLVAPPTSVAFAGPEGGPFTPSNRTFRLSNAGSSNLNWALGAIPNWVSVSPSSGSLDAGQEDAITVAPTAPANVLSAGNYSATLLVSNLSDGTVLARQAFLDVLEPSNAPEAVFSVLHSFTGGGGAGPGELIEGPGGVFYGAAKSGGSNASGVVFQINTNGQVAVLHSFAGAQDGSSPWGALIFGPDGNLFGTAFQGGADDNGTVFSISTNGQFDVLTAFNITNGDLPYAGLALGSDGNFYGTTYQGGAFGRGTAFRMNPGGALQTLYSFSNGSDGGHVAARLLAGRDGNFYGTTWKGGDYGQGTVFALSTSGALNTLASLDGTNGGFPFAGLCQDDAGNFYGACSQGGANGFGSLFKISSVGQWTNLYSFTGGEDGANPRATLLAGADGNLYGTASGGGQFGLGTLFVLPPGGAPRTLVQFDGLNGANPLTALTQGSDGALYGATQSGGANGKGVVFRLAIDSAPQITVQPASQSVFAGANVQFDVGVLGSTPLSLQWQKDGTNLFAATNRVLNLPTVGLDAAGNYSVLVSNSLGVAASANAFLAVTSSAPYIVSQPGSLSLAAGENAVLSVAAFGNLPLIFQWRQNGNNLSDGGNISGSSTATLTMSSVTVANEGTYSVVVTNALGVAASSNVTLSVLAVSAPGTLLSTPHWFASNAGSAPGLVRGLDGNIYGTTQIGSAANGVGGGTLFRLTTNGVFTTLVSFDDSDSSPAGWYPLTPLVQDANGNFFGTTSTGGTNGDGTVFELTPGNDLAVLYSFASGNDGNTAPLIIGSDGQLYGVGDGGDFGQGNIYRLSNSGAFTNLYSFTGGNDGAQPAGALVEAADGNFYGMTGNGGAYGYGTIFRLSPQGALTTQYAFSGGPDGFQPVGALAQGDDGFLYGATEMSSTNVANMTFQAGGTLFKISTNGVKSLVHEYVIGGDGLFPSAGLMQASDGNFYGVTMGSLSGPLESGPSYINGTVFRLTPDGNLTNLVEFDGFDDGARPASTLAEGGDGALYGGTSKGGPGNHGTVFRLSFTTPPQFTAQPASRTVAAGTSVALSVAVSAAPPRFYQWVRNGTNLTDTGNVSGSTNRVLKLSNVTLFDSAAYSVVVSNALGSAASSNALLTVVSQPVFQAISAANGSVTLSWSAMAGRSYQLQSKDALDSPNWASLGQPVAATNSLVFVTIAAGTNAQRFYRVLLTPE